MKRLLVLLPLLAILVLGTACSEEDPSVRVRNDLDVKVNVQLKPDAGSTININDVEGGTATALSNIQEGWWTATASVQSSNAEPESRFEAKNDVNYTVVIRNTAPPTMEIQSEDK
ncbi:MAG: hypothetical protein RRA94_12745 [Bacteroidota bacterium]|nr:hypothetical protein [Bacteroidota bacterium]